MRSLTAADGAVPLPTRRLAIIAVVVVAALTVLAFLSYIASWYGGIRTTVEYGWGWVAGYLAVLGAMLPGIGLGLRKAPAVVASGRVKQVAYAICGVAGLAMMSAFAVFSGIPILLHLLTSADGELTVTVIDKDQHIRRRACEPRLVIEELTFPVFDHVCPSRAMFRRIETGSRLRLIGEVSLFGITPDRLVVLAPGPGNTDS